MSAYVNTRNPGRECFQSNNPHIPTQNQSLAYLKARSVGRDRLELAETSLCKVNLSSTPSTAGHPGIWPWANAKMERMDRCLISSGLVQRLHKSPRRKRALPVTSRGGL